MSARQAVQYSVNLALIIAVVLVVAVCYFTLLDPSKLDCETYKRLPAIHVVSTGIVVTLAIRCTTW